MNFVYQILKEQWSNFTLILRLSMFQEKGKYNMHYLGVLWKIINPFTMIAIYWFVFGFGIRGGSSVEDTPFFLWLITGLVPWLFISPTVSTGSNSVYSNISLVSKMKFPVSVLPTIKLVENSISFFFMMLITILILLLNGYFSGIYLVQLPYYLLCLYVLLYGLTLLLSTLTTIVRDIQPLVQSVLRVMLYLLPILWDVHSLPKLIVNVLELNPFFYIINGFRDSLLGGNWFFDDPAYTFYFWLITLLILLMGSKVHLKLRHKFVDYI